MSTRIVDCRPLDQYRLGHVPDAVHLDRESDLTGEIGDASRGRHPLPAAADFAASASRAGIGAETFVLAYDAGDGWAQRCWWLLRHFGHERAGTFDLRSYAGALDRTETHVDPAEFVPRERTDDTIAIEEIRARLGRIPGARNAFFEEPLPAGLSDAPEIAVYCGSGVTACVPLQRLILGGREDARLYPGSFSEWCRHADTPIERS